MNANEVYRWMLIWKCLLAMLILMLVILMLILVLLNLNTGYADTDADLCIRIMSLCCNRDALYRVFLPETIFEIHQWSEPRHGKGLANIIWIFLKDRSLTCHLNYFSFFSSSILKTKDMTFNTFKEKPQK